MDTTQLQQATHCAAITCSHMGNLALSSRAVYIHTRTQPGCTLLEELRWLMNEQVL